MANNDAMEVLQSQRAKLLEKEQVLKGEQTVDRKNVTIQHIFSYRRYRFLSLRGAERRSNLIVSSFFDEIRLASARAANAASQRQLNRYEKINSLPAMPITPVLLDALIAVVPGAFYSEFPQIWETCM